MSRVDTRTRALHAGSCLKRGSALRAPAWLLGSVIRLNTLSRSGPLRLSLYLNTARNSTGDNIQHAALAAPRRARRCTHRHFHLPECGSLDTCRKAECVYLLKPRTLCSEENAPTYAPKTFHDPCDLMDDAMGCPPRAHIRMCIDPCLTCLESQDVPPCQVNGMHHANRMACTKWHASSMDDHP